MESIVPIIVVIYLAVSVITAVMQSLKNQQRSAPPKIPKVEPISKPEQHGEQTAEPVVMQHSPLSQTLPQPLPKADLRREGDGFDTDWSNDGFDDHFAKDGFGRQAVRRSKTAAAVSEVLPVFSSKEPIVQRMQEAVILSEVLREPRALRPWPHR